MDLKNNSIKGVIFGFDGVIFNTDIYHFLSWKKSLQMFGINIDPTFQYKLSGINREESLEKILDFFNMSLKQRDKDEILSEKNRIFNKMTSDNTKRMAPFSEIGHRTGCEHMSK